MFEIELYALNVKLICVFIFYNLAFGQQLKIPGQLFLRRCPKLNSNDLFAAFCNKDTGYNLICINIYIENRSQNRDSFRQFKPNRKW